jgi:parvulin-like peptidyl-prolyl isomerase
MNKKKKNILIISISSALVLLISAFILIYINKWYPAATVGLKIISNHDWQKKVDQYHKTQNFYADQNLATADDNLIQEQALEDLIKIKILENLAKKNKITVTDDEINDAYHELVLNNIQGGEDSTAETLQEIYGLSIEEFKEQVITEYLWRQKLTEQLKDELKPLAKKKAEEVLKEAQSHPEQFETLATTYGEDSVAINGGDMGYIGRGEMISAYEDIAWQLEIGEVSALVETPAGYYIIKTEDKKTIDGEEEIKIRHIFIAIDLDKLIDEKLSSYQVFRFIK